MLLQTIIFFTIFFLVQGILNFYIFIRGWQALPPKPLFRILYTTVFSFFFISSIVSWFFFGLINSPLVRIIHWAEAFWYGMMVYFFLTIVIIDLIRFIGFLLRYRTSSVKHYEIIKQIIFVSIILLNVTAMYIGHKNASKLRITPITIEINKDAGNVKNLNVVMVSDFHLGSIITVERLKEIIRTINSLKPDIVLIPGDIVDNNIQPLIRQNLGSVLSKIESRYGVYASTGNHEFYGEDADRTVEYLGNHGVTFLRDEAIKIGHSFYIIGREDKTGESYYDRKRKPLEDIISHVDKTYPLILMDHRPSNLGDALVNGIDLQLSGHSHHGQIFPLNLITEMVYEVSWGYLKKGNTHYYVSCGVGSWGPPVRIGSVSEIVHITLRFVP
jgi:predicted MPP superfamily phosphohydrolase